MKKKHDKAAWVPLAHAKESFSKIKVNLEFLGVDGQYRCVMVSSSVAGEGKSTVTAHLAASLAASNRKTLLIDADMRHATAHQLFGMVNRTGLSDVIAGGLDWRVHTYPTDTPNLFLLSAGRMPPNPVELLGSARMSELLDEMRGEFDFVLIDSPPILLVPDAVSLSKHVDGVILVARHNYTARPALQDTMNALKISNKPVIGAILNGVPQKDGYGYGIYYGREAGHEPQTADARHAAP